MAGGYSRDSSHLRCFSGVRWTMRTWTAWFFSNLGGMGQSRYITSSPGSGTYSPSMLKNKGMLKHRIIDFDSGGPPAAAVTGKVLAPLDKYSYR